jgi:hypothetical protein
MEGVLQLWRRYENNKEGGSKQGEIILGNNIVFFGVCVCII